MEWILGTEELRGLLPKTDWILKAGVLEELNADHGRGHVIRSHRCRRVYAHFTRIGEGRGLVAEARKSWTGGVQIAILCHNLTLRRDRHRVCKEVEILAALDITKEIILLRVTVLLRGSILNDVDI